VNGGLVGVAEKYGTPVYITDLPVLERAAADFEDAFDTDWIRQYSLKANHLPAVTACFAARRWGANVVSQGEWTLAREAGVSDDRISLEGIGKTDAVLQAAADVPLAWAVIESAEEAAALEEYARGASISKPVEVHRSHGLLFLALTDEAGNLIWISSARRGAASEIKTARHDKLCQHLRTAGLGALADLGLVGLDQDPDDPVIITGVKRTRKKKLTAAQKQANQIIAAARAPVEHGFAALKNWRILTRLRLNPARATALLRALLVLTNLETTR